MSDVRALAAALAAVALAAAPAAAAPGDLDPSFSGDGRVSRSTSPGRSSPARSRCSPTGGSSSPATRATPAPAGRRATRRSGSRATPPTAAWTPSSATAGWSPRRSGPGARRPTTCSCCPTGAIVAAGWRASTRRIPASFALARYAPDGALDPASAAGGIGHAARRHGFAAISDLAAGPGDRVVGVGQAQAGGATASRSRASRSRRARPRLRPDGVGASRRPATYGFAAGGALLPDGRIVAVGRVGPVLGRRRTFASAARLTPGADGGFGRRAVAAPDGTSYSFANAAARAARRRRVAAGVATVSGGRRRMALVRSSRRSGVPTAAGRRRHRARARPDGSVATDVVGRPGRPRRRRRARRAPAEDHAFVLARFDAARRARPGFGAQGVVLTGLPGRDPAPRDGAGAVQADGKLVAGRHRAARAASGPQCTGGTAPLLAASSLPAAATRRRPRPPRRRPARRPPRPGPRPPSRVPKRPERPPRQGQACRCAASRPSAAAGRLSLRRLRRRGRALLHRLARALGPRRARGDLHA